MKCFLASLKKCTFFRKRSSEAILELLRDLKVTPLEFGPGDIIAAQGEPAEHLGIVLQGMVQVQKLFPEGEAVTMAHLSEGQTFGEAVLFAKEQYYPGSILPASSRCIVLMIPRGELVRLFQRDEQILTRFIENISNRVVMLAERIEILSLSSIRQKLLYFLAKEVKEQGSYSVKLPFTKRRLSEHLGIPRPSLSRELQRMQEEGILVFDRTHIRIQKPGALQHLRE